MLYEPLCEVANVPALLGTNRAHSHWIINNNTPALVYTSGVKLVGEMASSLPLLVLHVIVATTFQARAHRDDDD